MDGYLAKYPCDDVPEHPSRMAREQAERDRAQRAEQARQNEIADEIAAIRNDSAAKDVSFDGPTGRGRVFVTAQGVALIAELLPVIASNRVFELWIIPAGGTPIPAGMFNSKADSTAVHVFHGSTANAAAMAVTVEPAGGSTQPTTTPFIIVSVRQ